MSVRLQRLTRAHREMQWLNLTMRSTPNTSRLYTIVPDNHSSSAGRSMTTLLTAKIAHLLMFAYWLGGDVGAFYASFLVTDAKCAPAQRALALKILNAIDLAPAVALVLAFPTGWWLAAATGWLPLSAAGAVALVVATLIWVILAAALHLNHPATNVLWRRADLVVRIISVVGLATVGALTLVAQTGWLPAFIALKCLLLAACIVLGLTIRRQLRPFARAFAALMSTGASPEVNESIRSSMVRIRWLVVAIWVCLIAAAASGSSRFT